MEQTYKLKKPYKGITCNFSFFVRNKELVAVLPFSGEIIFPVSIMDEKKF